MRQTDLREKAPACPACFREYNGSDSEPRLFKSCGHSVCKSCLEEMISLTARSHIKCPICNRVHRFSRNDPSAMDAFPVNYELRSVMEVMQNQIPTENCVTHNQESSLLCLDPKCNRKYLSCALCIRNHHSNCRGEYIISSRMVGERVEFVANQYRRAPVRQMISDQVNKTFGDFLECFNQQTDILVDSLIPETPDISVQNITQLQAYHSQLSYKLNPQTKIISIRRKDEEYRGEKIQALKDKIEKFFNESFSLMLDKFISQNFEEDNQALEANSVSIHRDQEEPDRQIQNPPPLGVAPRQTNFPPIKNDENDPRLMLADEGNMLSIEVNRIIRSLTDDTFLAIEFINDEASRIDLLSPIFPNFQFLQFGLSTDIALFREFDIDVTPMYICFFKKGTEIRRVKLKRPTISELEDLLFRVAFNNDDL